MSYTIRDANHSDILDITIAAKLFSKETNHPALNTINPNKVATTLQQLIDSDAGIVKVACFNTEIVGAIAGVWPDVTIFRSPCPRLRTSKSRSVSSGVACR